MNGEEPAPNQEKNPLSQEEGQAAGNITGG